MGVVRVARGSTVWDRSDTLRHPPEGRVLEAEGRVAMNRLNGRVAIVTGASRGLGREIARAYAAEGASVALCARANSPTGLAGTVHEEAQRIRDAGGEALAVACDVADEGQVGAMVEQVVGHYGRIDILVNNAGVMIPSEPFLDIDPERWEQSMTINVRGPYLTSRHVIPVMMKQGEGRIINVGSGAAANHRAGGTVYCSSKAALHMFSLCLADELKENHIAVNILDPGPMKSEGSSVIPWTRHDWDERITPEEAAPSAVALALKDNRTFTGQLVRTRELGQTWDW